MVVGAAHGRLRQEGLREFKARQATRPGLGSHIEEEGGTGRAARLRQRHLQAPGLAFAPRKVQPAGQRHGAPRRPGLRGALGGAAAQVPAEPQQPVLRAGRAEEGAAAGLRSPKRGPGG